MVFAGGGPWVEYYTEGFLSTYEYKDGYGFG
jgi:hypothetical protein